MFWGAAARTEISSAGNLKNKLVLERRGPRGMRRMLRGDAGGAGMGRNQPHTESNAFNAKWGLGRVGGEEGEWSMPQGACFSDLRYLNYKF